MRTATKNNTAAVPTIAIFAAAAGILAVSAPAQIVHSEASRRLDYLNSDFDDQRFLSIDVDGDGSEEFDFTILNSSSESYLGGLDFSRNNGFIGDFDASDNFIFRPLSEGEEIGPAFEEDLGIETFTYADYNIDDATGGNLAEQEILIGFGFFASGLGPLGEDEGILYGWMRVRFGELTTTSDDEPSNTFIEVTEFAYNSQLGAGIAAGQIPAPAAPVALAFAGLTAARRRR